MSAKKITCEINGHKLEVPKGTSIIEAFKTTQQDIAHYCWHPGLSVAGVCRLCMVDIEGIPKLQIACNTEVKEGMKVSNQSEKVKDAVRWGLEFHLINHPLDCPICDQAGECELQEQYMRFGQYRPHMAEKKVQKRKVIDLGPKIVLDSERCILCSRCVRFTDEVSKTGELGIFHRGDKSEIGVFKDKPLNNNYAFNTVDICPVGALTSKDFRFRQRVWYLKTSSSLCSGCSTGCNIKVDHNEEGLFRVRPRYNKEINGHWICDKGRGMYALANPKGRLLKVLPPENKSNKLRQSPAPGVSTKGGSFLGGGKKKLAFSVAEQAQTILSLQQIRALFIENKARKLTIKHSLVLTAQYSNEEYEDFISFWIEHVGNAKDIYYWQNNLKNFNDFDGLLLRGDKNPNTKGLLQIGDRLGLDMPILQDGEGRGLEQKGNQRTVPQPVSPARQAESAPRSLPHARRVLWVAGPENQGVYLDLEQKIRQFESFYDHVIWWTVHPLPVSSLKKTWQIPTKAFFEKGGTFVNYKGVEQKTKALGCFVSSALSLSQSAVVLGGGELNQTASSTVSVGQVSPSGRAKAPSGVPLASQVSPVLKKSVAGPSFRAVQKPEVQPLKTNHFTLKKRAL